jgi:hypothetical protein
MLHIHTHCCLVTYRLRSHIVMRLSTLAGILALVVLLVGGYWFVTSPAAPIEVAQNAPAQRGMNSTAPRPNAVVTQSGPIVSEASAATVSAPARTLPITTGELLVNREMNPRQNLETLLAGQVELPNGGRDPLADVSVNGGESPTTTLVFEGISFESAGDGFPPDTVGDVGPNHYVQAINVAFQVYDKEGTSLGGPFEIGALWTQGPCAGLNAGDPIVFYDELADRWFISQFYSNGICMALSQTPDPLGSYYLYNFSTPQFPDYFKIGLWENAYYMGSNENTYSAYAIDRAAMLKGESVTTIRFTGETNLLMPADIDGTVGPGDVPGVFYTFKDDDYHGGEDRLEISHFDPDFTTPANSTFEVVTTIPITDYTYTVCGFFNLNCIRQADTTQRLDAVSEWPMWRLAYRNFGTYESLVGNFAVDVGGDVSAIRWFELRKAGDDEYSLYQEGTYAPDGDNRFMGSIAQDAEGNIALGYNVSGTATHPSLRYAVRTASDPLGTLRSEAVLLNGDASQTGVIAGGITAR